MTLPEAIRFFRFNAPRNSFSSPWFLIRLGFRRPRRLLRRLPRPRWGHRATVEAGGIFNCLLRRLPRPRWGHRATVEAGGIVNLLKFRWFFFQKKFPKFYHAGEIIIAGLDLCVGNWVLALGNHFDWWWEMIIVGRLDFNLCVGNPLSPHRIPDQPHQFVCRKSPLPSPNPRSTTLNRQANK
jgi:hypothetical protein